MAVLREHAMSATQRQLAVPRSGSSQCHAAAARDPCRASRGGSSSRACGTRAAPRAGSRGAARPPCAHTPSSSSGRCGGRTSRRSSGSARLSSRRSQPTAVCSNRSCDHTTVAHTEKISWVRSGSASSPRGARPMNAMHAARRCQVVSAWRHWAIARATSPRDALALEQRAEHLHAEPVDDIPVREVAGREQPRERGQIGSRAGDRRAARAARGSPRACPR